MAKRILNSKAGIKRSLYRKISRHGKRFHSALDMAIAKYDITVRNSRIKRGDIELKGNNHGITFCGCGATGCFVHFSYPNREI